MFAIVVASAAAAAAGGCLQGFVGTGTARRVAAAAAAAAANIHWPIANGCHDALLGRGKRNQLLIAQTSCCRSIDTQHGCDCRLICGQCDGEQSVRRKDHQTIEDQNAEEHNRHVETEPGAT